MFVSSMIALGMAEVAGSSCSGGKGCCRACDSLHKVSLCFRLCRSRQNPNWAVRLAFDLAQGSPETPASHDYG